MADYDPGVGDVAAAMLETTRRAAEALQPESDIIARLDAAGFGEALRQLPLAWAVHPGAAAGAVARFWAGMAAAGLTVVQRAAGSSVRATIKPDPKDRRFADPAWEHNAFFFGLEQGYLLACRLLMELLEAADLQGPERGKAEFALKALTDALAPTNTLAGNPAALHRAFETGGLSILQGVRNFVDDLMNNGGMPRQVDASGFEVGRNLAATPGRVVFRNELMELIQYDAQTETTFGVPLLLSPPWINKYYIMDLAPGRSFAEWAVQHGHTTFAISYRNPDASMRDVSLDDYLVHGPIAAMDVMAEISGQPTVNVVGLCLGGTLTAILLAYLAQRGDDRVGCATLLNTLVDFSDPGILGVFTDEPTVARLEASMAQKGFMEARQMAGTFDLLRANDLIWSYVGTNWLMGQTPPPFDLLAWNGDSTRMPAAMHSFYLRSCYRSNQLAQGVMEVAGTTLHLDDITEDVYILGAKEDHIAPWKSQYRTTGLLKSTRFVLSSSGHIAGIVNPPSPKAVYWTNDYLTADADGWLAGATTHAGSWWEDWATWMSQRAGERRTPPPTGSPTHPALGPAPGTYVRAK